MMKVKFSTTKHLEYVEGVSEVYGSYADEFENIHFIVWDGEEFRAVRCSECKPYIGRVAIVTGT